MHMVYSGMKLGNCWNRLRSGYRQVIIIIVKTTMVESMVHGSLAML